MIVVLVLLGAGCGQRSETKAEVPAPAPVRAPKVEPVVPKVAEPNREMAQAEAARALISTWVEAQNTGNFEQYSALYAERFTGVKRAGSRVSRYDREHWLADRRGMFRKPMHVEANNIQVRSMGPAVQVRFTQKWSSARFADEGDKSMMLAPGNDGLRISSEAMLSSNVGSAGHAVPMSDDFRFVMQTKGARVVLSVEGDDGWSQGTAVLDSPRDAQTLVARKPVPLEGLPASIRDAHQKTYDLYGRDGRVCTARLGEVAALRPLTPHFGMRQCWDYTQHEHCTETARSSDAQVATDVWDWTAAIVLVADAIPVAGDCKGALWARVADRPAPTIFVPEDISDALVTRVIDRVRALPSYKALARDYVRQPDEPEHWEQDSDSVMLTGWRSGERLLVTYEARYFGCGGPPSLTAVFEVHGDRLQSIADYPRNLTPEALFDANLDGIPDLQSTSWPQVGAANIVMMGCDPATEIELDLNYSDCPC